MGVVTGSVGGPRRRYGLTFPGDVCRPSVSEAASFRRWPGSVCVSAVTAEAPPSLQRLLLILIYRLRLQASQRPGSAHTC